jgi:hypothetical protein
VGGQSTSEEVPEADEPLMVASASKLEAKVASRVQEPGKPDARVCGTLCQEVKAKGKGQRAKGKGQRAKGKGKGKGNDNGKGEGEGKGKGEGIDKGTGKGTWKGKVKGKDICKGKGKTGKINRGKKWRYRPAR